MDKIKKQRIIVYLTNIGLVVGSFLLFIVLVYCKLYGIENEKQYSKNINAFYEKGTVYSSWVDEQIEEDYFAENILHNGSFTQGLGHWALSGSTEMFACPLNNTLEISSKEYKFAPHALKITAVEYPCRLFYTKDAAEEFLQHPWSINRSRTWLGVKANKQIKMSAYYKGAGPTITINLLDSAGEMITLKRLICPESNNLWEKARIDSVIPQDGRAIMLEIQVTSPLFAPKILLLDDVTIEVSDNGRTTQ